MSEYMQDYIKRLRELRGNAFIEQLYQALKAEHGLEEAQLPPVPGRTVQLRSEHDIRSRLPKYFQAAPETVEDTGFYGRQIRYSPEGDERAR